MQRVGKVVNSVKSKTVHVGQFNCLTYDLVSFNKLRQKIAISRSIKTRVKLSKDGWTDSGSGFFSRHKLKRMSVPLNDIECLIQDEFSSNVLFCVFILRPGNDEEFRYSIVAYKFSDVVVIGKFGELFSELRGEVVEEVINPIEGDVLMRRRTVDGEISMINVNRPNSTASHRHSGSYGVYLTIGNASDSGEDDDEDAGSIDHVFDDVFDGNLEELSQKIYPSPGLLTILREKRVLTREQIDDVRAQRTDERKSVRLMELLKKRPNSCFGNFIEALEKTEQRHIAKFLRRGSRMRRASTSAVSITENQRQSTASLDRRSNKSSQRSDNLVRSTSRLASNNSLSRTPTISQTSLVNQNATARKSCMRSNRKDTGSEFGSRTIAWSPSYESLSGSRSQRVSQL